VSSFSRQVGAAYHIGKMYLGVLDPGDDREMMLLRSFEVMRSKGKSPSPGAPATAPSLVPGSHHSNASETASLVRGSIAHPGHSPLSALVSPYPPPLLSLHLAFK